MNSIKKIALALSGSVAAVGAYVLSAASAHAQAFTVSTSTLNEDAGSMLQAVYTYLISILTDGGAVQFVIVLTILAGIIALVIWGLHKLFGGRRVR